MFRLLAFALALGLFILAARFPLTAASSAIRYVSVSGNDCGNGACAQATPCRTIGNAIAIAAANDTIHIGTGSFKENAMTLAKNLKLIGQGIRNTLVNAQGKNSVFIVNLASLHPGN